MSMVNILAGIVLFLILVAPILVLMAVSVVKCAIGIWRDEIG